MTNVASKNVNILLLVRNWSLLWIKCVSNSRYTWMITKLRYCFQRWMRDLFCWKISILIYIQFLKLKGGGVCRFFDRCILTGSALKLILYGFPLILYWTYETSKIFLISRIIFRHRCIFGDHQRLSLIMELLIHCYTALVLEIGCKFGYLIAT